MDWLSTLVPVGISGLVAGVYVALHFRNTARPEVYPGVNGNPRSSLEPRIPLEVQQEINQDPEWWDREFHKELAKVQPKLEIDTGEDEYIEERSFTSGVIMMHRIPKPYEYLGCTCRDCKNARRMR